jgi:hypothetical protein
MVARSWTVHAGGEGGCPGGGATGTTADDFDSAEEAGFEGATEGVDVSEAGDFPDSTCATFSLSRESSLRRRFACALCSTSITAALTSTQERRVVLILFFIAESF